MKARYILPLLITFILLIVSGCREEETAFRHQLDEAEVLMRTDAQSAFRQLCDLNEEAEKQEKALRMRHLLLRCNAQNKADSLFSSDSLGLLLTRYYDGQDMPNQRVLAHYVLGCAYRDMKDDASALFCFSNAVAAADTSTADCDFYQLSIIYGQMGAIYVRGLFPEEALEAYGKAERYAAQLHDTLGILNIWANKTNAYIYQKRMQEALDLKEKAASGYQRLGYHQQAAQTRGLCIKWLAQDGKLEKAKHFLDDYISNSGYFQPQEYGKPRSGHEGCYDIVAFYYLASGQLDSSEYYLKKWLPVAMDINDSIRLYNYLYQLFMRKEETDSVAKYAVASDRATTRLLYKVKENNYPKIQLQSDCSRYNQKCMQYQMEVQSYQIRFWQTVCMALIAVVGLIAAMWTFWKRIDRFMRLCSQRLSVAYDNFLKKQQELSKKKEELSRKQEQIRDYREKEAQQECYKKVLALYKTPAVKLVHEMARDESRRPSHQELEAMCTEVEQAYPAFCEIRKNPKINDKEYVLCALVKLGFDKRKIKFIMDISDSNYANMRARMYGKIQSQEGGANDFDEYISRI